MEESPIFRTVEGSADANNGIKSGNLDMILSRLYELEEENRRLLQKGGESSFDALQSRIKDLESQNDLLTGELAIAQQDGLKQTSAVKVDSALQPSHKMTDVGGSNDGDDNSVKTQARPASAASMVSPSKDLSQENLAAFSSLVGSSKGKHISKADVLNRKKSGVTFGALPGLSDSLSDCGRISISSSSTSPTQSPRRKSFSHSRSVYSSSTKSDSSSKRRSNSFHTNSLPKGRARSVTDAANSSTLSNYNPLARSMGTHAYEQFMFRPRRKNQSSIRLKSSNLKDLEAGHVTIEGESARTSHLDDFRSVYSDDTGPETPKSIAQDDCRQSMRSEGSTFRATGLTGLEVSSIDASILEALKKSQNEIDRGSNEYFGQIVEVAPGAEFTPMRMSPEISESDIDRPDECESHRADEYRDVDSSHMFEYCTVEADLRSLNKAAEEEESNLGTAEMYSPRSRSFSNKLLPSRLPGIITATHPARTDDPNKQVLQSIQQLEEFCFPGGIPVDVYSSSCFDLVSGKHMDSFHIWQFSDLLGRVSYACCLTVSTAVELPTEKALAAKLLDMALQKKAATLIKRAFKAYLLQLKRRRWQQGPARMRRESIMTAKSGPVRYHSAHANRSQPLDAAPYKHSASIYVPEDVHMNATQSLIRTPSEASITSSQGFHFRRHVEDLNSAGSATGPSFLKRVFRGSPSAPAGLRRLSKAFDEVVGDKSYDQVASVSVDKLNKLQVQLKKSKDKGFLPEHFPILYQSEEILRRFSGISPSSNGMLHLVDTQNDHSNGNEHFNEKGIMRALSPVEVLTAESFSKTSSRDDIAATSLGKHPTHPTTPSSANETSSTKTRADSHSSGDTAVSKIESQDVFDEPESMLGCGPAVTGTFGGVNSVRVGLDADTNRIGTSEKDRKSRIGNFIRSIRKPRRQSEDIIRTVRSADFHTPTGAGQRLRCGDSTEVSRSAPTQARRMSGNYPGAFRSTSSRSTGVETVDEHMRSWSSLPPSTPDETFERILNRSSTDPAGIQRAASLSDSPSEMHKKTSNGIKRDRRTLRSMYGATGKIVVSRKAYCIITTLSHHALMYKVLVAAADAERAIGRDCVFKALMSRKSTTPEENYASIRSPTSLLFPKVLTIGANGDSITTKFIGAMQRKLIEAECNDDDEVYENNVKLDSKGGSVSNISYAYWGRSMARSTASSTSRGFTLSGHDATAAGDDEISISTSTTLVNNKAHKLATTSSDNGQEFFDPVNRLSNLAFQASLLQERLLLPTTKEWTFAVLLSSVPPSQIFQMMNLLLTEKSLIIVGKNVGVVTALSFAATNLLEPFSWEGVFVPILPDSAREIFGAPVPYIVGTTTAPRMDDVSPSAAILYLSEVSECIHGTAYTTGAASELAPSRSSTHPNTPQSVSSHPFPEAHTITFTRTPQPVTRYPTYTTWFTRLPEMSADMPISVNLKHIVRSACAYFSAGSRAQRMIKGSWDALGDVSVHRKPQPTFPCPSEDRSCAAHYLQHYGYQTVMPAINIYAMASMLKKERDCVRTTLNAIYHNNSQYTGDDTDPTVWLRYVKFNAGTGEDEFQPAQFMEEIVNRVEFQEHVVKTQMFVGYVDRMRTEISELDSFREQIAVWIYFRLHMRRVRSAAIKAAGHVSDV